MTRTMLRVTRSSLIGRFARSPFTLLLAVTAAACGRDSATAPVSRDAALRLEAVSATEVAGIVGEQVNPAPTVLVRDGIGRPVSGIKVMFAPLSAWDSTYGVFVSTYGDFVTNRIVISDSLGVASPGDWTLGTMAGLHGLEASILDAHLSHPDSGAGRVVAFRAQAKAAAPAALTISFTGDTVGLPGDELEPPTAKVIDRFKNGVDGVTVSFSIMSGGGSLASTHDESRFGYASPGTWTLGPNAGLNSVVASAPGLNSVTFSARALDMGVVTWYDMKPQFVRLISSGAIALGENGAFEIVTVEGSDAFPGEWRARQLGTYTLTGTTIVLTYSTGGAEQGTLVNDSLSVMRKKENWGDPPQLWTFVKRPHDDISASLFISGVMTPQHQSVRVSHRGGAPITDAVVTVNGVPIQHCCGHLYSGNLPGAVPAGGTLNLKVVAGGVSVEATGEVTPMPTITAPASGSTFAPTDSVRLAWSIPTDPDRFEVCLNCWENSLDGAIYPALGAAREFKIAPGALADYGEGAVVAVYAFRNNFLKSVSSPAVSSNVLFLARSSDALITIINK